MDLNVYLKQLEELVNIDSGSHNAAGINRVADCLERWYKELGWHVESVEPCVQLHLGLLEELAERK